MNTKKQKQKLKHKTKRNSPTRAKTRTVGLFAQKKIRTAISEMFTIDTNAGLIPIKVQNALFRMRDAQKTMTI